MKEHLRSRDYQAIQSVIFELNSFTDLTEFRKSLPGIMLRLIPAGYFAWNEIQFINGVLDSVGKELDSSKIPKQS